MKSLRATGPALLVTAAVALASCAQPAPAPRGPTVGELSSRLPVAQPTEDPGSALMTAQVVRIDLPLEADLAPAWSLATRENFASAQVRAWEANGLRVGVVGAAKANEFLAALAPSLGTNVQRITTGDRPAPLVLTPTIRRPVHVEVTRPPAGAEAIDLPPGRCQFLLTLSPGVAANTVYVQLVPHHYRPKATVQVRTPTEKALDGDVFSELALQGSVRSDQLLVVGLTPVLRPRPVEPPATPAPATPEESPGGEAKTDAPNPPPPAPRLGLEALPPRLGTLLLAAARGARPIQIVLVLRVQSAKNAEPAKAPLP